MWSPEIQRLPCRYGLARLNPFLSHVMALKEANSVTASVTPLAMHIPFEAMTVRVSPLKLQIKGSRLTRGAIRLLEFRSNPSLYALSDAHLLHVQLPLLTWEVLHYAR